MQGFDGVAARWVSHKTCNCARVTCTAAALGTREIYWARIEARRRAVSPGRRASNENKLPNAAACSRGAHSMHLATCSMQECVLYVCIENMGKSELQ
jgi:hypothetical protein